MGYHPNRYVLYSATKSYGRKPRFINNNEDSLPQGFTSLYAVDGETAKAIVEEGTTKGFKGVVWGQKLWLDVDNYEAASEVEERLKKMKLAFVAYDSGSKGAHFGIERKAMPSHLLPSRDKAWVKEHFPEADVSIYTHLHPFRTPGTVHEITGRVKRLVAAESGNTLTLPPRREEMLIVPKSTNELSVFDCFRVMYNIGPAENGERHAQLVRLAYALKDDAGVDAETALWWSLEVNKRFQSPKTQEEVERIVRSIYG